MSNPNAVEGTREVRVRRRVFQLTKALQQEMCILLSNSYDKVSVPRYEKKRGTAIAGTCAVYRMNHARGGPELYDSETRVARPRQSLTHTRAVSSCHDYALRDNSNRTGPTEQDDDEGEN